MKQMISIGLMLVMYIATSAQPTPVDATMHAFIDNLLKQMTLEEKLGQLNLPVAGDITTGQATTTNFAQKVEKGLVGGLFNIKNLDKIRDVQKLAVEKTRLKIPLLFAMDVIHGYRTVFPIPLGLSCTWDIPAIERSARIAAQEATAEGINWTFSPMVDLSRDPRWGRVAEGSGEDPYLGGEIAKAMVRGYQGKNLAANNTMLSCIKHFALYGAADAGRDYGTVDMSRQRMYNEYFLPYKAGIEAGAGTVMASFNGGDGIPATGSKWLMTDVLRKQWGFNGFVVTDYTGIMEMEIHGIGDFKSVSAQALQAGIDMDMVSEGFLKTIAGSVAEGKVKMEEVDAACRRILEAKYRLGLFEDPFRYINPERSKNEVYTAANRAEARRIAAESFVLLKNENNVLPLKKQGTIAVVGPLADNARNMPGTWAVAADYSKGVTVVQGLREVLGDRIKVLHAHGTNLDYDSAFNVRAGAHGKSVKWDTRPREVIVGEALDIAKQADVIVAVVGESSEMSGESSSRTSIDIPQAQKDMLMELQKTGKPIVLVLFTGRPLALTWEHKNFPAILNVWFPGSEAGYAIADVLFGDVNPCGKLTMTFPQNLGQVPLFYNHKMTGRPQDPEKWFTKFKTNYLDVTNDPLYPFGYGLSYTQFSYGDLTLSGKEMQRDGNITTTIAVTNTGKYEGKEVVQLYIRDVVGSVTRPVKELKGFQKIELKPGETKQVTFTIKEEDLKFYNYDLDFVAEPGEFHVMVGGNSKDTKMASFTLR
jgi:beta-glucosidase